MYCWKCGLDVGYDSDTTKCKRCGATISIYSLAESVYDRFDCWDERTASAFKKIVIGAIVFAIFCCLFFKMNWFMGFTVFLMVLLAACMHKLGELEIEYRRGAEEIRSQESENPQWFIYRRR